MSGLIFFERKLSNSLYTHYTLYRNAFYPRRSAPVRTAWMNALSMHFLSFSRSE
jgi:hypothetical protein